jgi:uncharacterized protein DUF6600
MKKHLFVLLCVVAAGFSLTATRSVAGVNVGFSVSVFSGPLSGCGHWVDRAPYGRCWYPAYVSSGWRPYCNGYWMWTDCGWYWVSDEPWAWACYHYGRWVYDPYYGWLWVPDTVWGPSWVAWRSSDNYVGWAPLSPECGFGPGGGFVFREEFIRPSAFVFVDVHHFSDPVRPNTVIVNNTTIINKTINVTKITQVNNVVVNNGPRVDVVQRVTPRKLTTPPEKMSRWTGFATTPHPAPEVLQPSAVRARQQAERKSNSEGLQPAVIRPRIKASPESVTPNPMIEENRRKEARSVQMPATEDRSITYTPTVRQERPEPSGEHKYQNFGPRPYPYGKVSGARVEQVSPQQSQPHGRSSQPAEAGEGRGQPDRGERRGQGD